MAFLLHMNGEPAPVRSYGDLGVIRPLLLGGLGLVANMDPTEFMTRARFTRTCGRSSMRTATAILAVVLLGLVPVSAQQPNRGGMGPGMTQGMHRQMTGMMQQMGGLMEQMGEMMASGQMSPERMRQMGELMKEMGSMMAEMNSMRGGRMEPGTMMPDMSKMMERMAEMQKRMSEMMKAPK